MGKKRKAGEGRELEEEELAERQWEEDEKPLKKKQKKERDPQLDSSHASKQPKSRGKEREKKRKKEESNNEGIQSYYLPGQIHEIPNERDPLRIFLETLHQQLPEDELARKWMMEWGLLPQETAVGLLEKTVNEKDVLSDGVGKAKAKLKKKKVRL